MDPETTERWQRLEKDVARLFRGKLTIGSGNKWEKGDVDNGALLFECKFRSGPSDCCFPLQIEWLEAIWNQAAASRRIPALAIEWGGGHRAVLLPAEIYDRLPGAQGQMPHEEVPTRERLLCCNSLSFPTGLSFPKIEVPALCWVICDWEQAVELLQPPQEPAAPKRSSWPKRSGLGRKPWGNRPRTR